MSLNGLERIQDCHVASIPFPGRSHINPMIHVCNLLASKGLTITVVLTEELLSLVGPGSGSGPKTHNNVRFRSIPNVLPPEQDPGRDFVDFIVSVSTKMEAPVDQLLDQLDPPPTCIIADTFLAWPVAKGNRRNIPVASVFILSPAMFSLHYHFHLLVANGHHPVDTISERKDEIINYIPGIQAIRLGDLPFIYLPSHEIIKKILENFYWVKKAQFILFTTFYELQAHTIDTLRGILPMPIYPIGPSIPFLPLQDIDTPSEASNGNAAVDYFKWLDSQPKNSVFYVSFGSFLTPSATQVHEFAMGLHTSGVRYLWVARDQALNLQETCGEMGLVIPWCDQLRVLCHSSIGGFMSQCGWNSTLESIYSGVPMLTFPLLADQHPTSGFIVEDLKIGLRVREDTGTDNVVGRDEIARVVQRLMDGDEGIQMRERAKEIQKSCRNAIEKDGSTYSNLHAFIEELRKRRRQRKEPSNRDFKEHGK